MYLPQGATAWCHLLGPRTGCYFRRLRDLRPSGGKAKLRHSNDPSLHSVFPRAPLSILLSRLRLPRTIRLRLQKEIYRTAVLRLGFGVARLRERPQFRKDTVSAF